MGVIIFGIDAPGSMRWKAANPGKHLGGFAVYNMSTDKLLKVCQIEFGERGSEKDDLVALRKLLDGSFKEYHPQMIVVEHPFLHVIAQFVGAVKMWVATKRNLNWYMINPSQAQKLVFGKALHKQRETKTGRMVSDSKWKKEQVLNHVRKKFKLAPSLSQHEADAVFYALAVAERIRREP